jgi:hypothetical protein
MRPPTSRTIPTRDDGRPGVSRRHERRLTLADLMLLVAATAPGLAVARFADTLGLYDERVTRGAGKVRLALEAMYVFGTPVLIPWTLLVLFLSVRGPGPSLRRVAGRPGFVACACVVLTILIQAPALIVRASLIRSFSEVGTLYVRATGAISENSGELILGAWLALALAGRRRPGPSWADRFGCILGIIYILIFLSNTFYFALLPIL